jgi:peptidoglycan/LPS O-acetylase OafA/YrhL
MQERKLQKIEMVRGFSAFYIFSSHVLGGLTGPVNILWRFGQEMVISFFLLSGFVIYFATHLGSDHSFRGYFVRRFRRIYPIFLLALVVTYGVLLLLGRPQIDLWQLLGNLFLLQDFNVKPGVWFPPFGDNRPLWSLSYEWWFYMMFFPIYRYVPAKHQLFLVAGISFTGLATYIAFPNQVSLILLYFIIWWTGLEFARTYCSGRVPNFSTQRDSLIILAAFCLFVPLGMVLLMPHPAYWSEGVHPILEARHFLAAFLLATLALAWSAARWKYFDKCFGFFAYFGPISYALYVFHFPLCVAIRESPRFFNITAGIIGIMLSLLLAYFAEVPLQRAIVRVTNRWLYGRKAAQMPLPVH